MKIAFTSKGVEWDSRMDPRFGRAEFILVFDAISSVVFVVVLEIMDLIIE